MHVVTRMHKCITGCVWSGGGPASEDPTGLNPPPEASNSVIVSSFYYIVQLRLICEYALLLGHPDDYKHYSAGELETLLCVCSVLSTSSALGILVLTVDLKVAR